jgi:hypothetical protein
MANRYHFEIPKKNIRTEKYEKSGGGTNYQRINHDEHGRNLLGQTAKLLATEFSKKDSGFTSDVFLQIETPETLSVKGEKPKIENLGFEVISFSKDNKSIGTAKISKGKLEIFESKLKEYTESTEHTYKSYFSVIESISSVPPENKIKTTIDLESNEEISIVINLYNALAPKERLAIYSSIIEELKNIGTDVNQRTFKNGITSIECKLKSNNIPLLLNEFTTIKEIKPNFTALVENSIPAEDMPNPLNIENVESNSIICVIDSGVKMDNGIFDNLVSEQVIMLPPTSIEAHYNHGCFVASRCIFGDNIDACIGTHSLKPFCRVLDVQVFGKDSYGERVNPSEYHLRTVIEDIVIKYHTTVKVYNLSLGVDHPINDYEYSDLAKLLDFLSKTYKVLFVVASGNIRKQLGDFPVDHFSSTLARIGLPAESLLSLTVGSIAKYFNATALSELNEVSPFSRIGPGSDLGIKPELVAHGGNLINPYSPSPRTSTYGIAIDGKKLSVDNGTSFSAPLISQYAQRLFDVYPQSNPNLVKALLCHFTEPRLIHEELTNNSMHFTGFGEPIIDNAMVATEYNSAYIYEGDLDQENYQIISFHIPESLSKTKNPECKLKIKITITYDPPVNPDNDVEYSQARISALLSKPTIDGMRPITISGDDKHFSLPWNPIIQFEKSFSRSYLNGTWELRLRLWTRGKIPADYLQDYAVVIELIDENKSTNVFDDISNEFSEIYSQIQLRKSA